MNIQLSAGVPYLRIVVDNAGEIQSQMFHHVQEATTVNLKSVKSLPLPKAYDDWKDPIQTNITARIYKGTQEPVNLWYISAAFCGAEFESTEVISWALAYPQTAVPALLTRLKLQAAFQPIGTMSVLTLPVLELVRQLTPTTVETIYFFVDLNKLRDYLKQSGLNPNFVSNVLI